MKNFKKNAINKFNFFIMSRSREYLVITETNKKCYVFNKIIKAKL